jgi:hypothetical protein
MREMFPSRAPPMRSKARGLARHGGPPGRPEVSALAGVIVYMMDGPYRTVLIALTGAVPSCELMEFQATFI